jgi:hypothetical protein
MAADDCQVGDNQVPESRGLAEEEQEPKAGGSSDEGAAAVADKLGALAAVVVAVAAAEAVVAIVGAAMATWTWEASRPWSPADSFVNCIYCQAQVMEWAQLPEQRCIAADRCGTAEACNFDLQVEAASSLSAADGYCSGTEAWRRLMPYHWDCIRPAVFQHRTMLSLTATA